jgi:DivIVA domain-containing protein
VDRDAIERRDFPVGRRGYDQAAVDAHLRRVADEMDALRDRAAAPRGAGLSAGASDRVREILEAAEHTAGEIRETASREAGEHVARVAEAAAAMMSRIDQLQRELDGLLDGLRGSGRALEDGLARLQEDVHGLEVADRPDPPTPEPIPEPPVAPPEPEPAIDEPADAAAFTGEGPDEAGARLIALNMALAGTPREETAAYLADHYELRDASALLDDVYSRVDR